MAWVTVYVSEDDSAWTVWMDSSSADSAVYAGLDDHTYYFYAQAADSAGNMETAAAAECTTTVDTSAPALPVMLSPADGAVMADTAATFTWTRVVKAAGRDAPLKRDRQESPGKATPVTYSLLCAFDQTFDSLAVGLAGLTDSTLTVPLDDGIYYWRVSATDGAGHTSGFPMTPYSFQIDTQPPAISAASLWPDTTFLGPFAVSVTVEDASGADPVLLWYRTSLDTVLRADTMEAPGARGGYIGAIPEQAAADSILIEYYIEARDAAVPANAATDPAGAPDDTVYAFMAYGPVSVEEDPGTALPQSFALQQNYPNPFNARTIFRYHLPGWAAPGGTVPVRLDIYNVRGQLVNQLVRAHQAPGIYQAVWDGTDSNGSPAGSGLYFCRLQAAGRHRVVKAILLR